MDLMYFLQITYNKELDQHYQILNIKYLMINENISKSLLNMICTIF